MKIYWVRQEGRWTSVFITTSNIPKNEFGNIVGKIYNMRRKYSHKKLRLCWRNLKKKSVNEYKSYSVWPTNLEDDYEGPFPVDWEY